jgi:hypothetical protein
MGQAQSLQYETIYMMFVSLNNQKYIKVLILTLIAVTEPVFWRGRGAGY